MKWRTYSWIRRLSIVTTSILPKLIDLLNIIPKNNPKVFLVELNKLIWKLIWNSKDPRRFKTLRMKMNQMIKVALPISPKIFAIDLPF